jgi:hypothetical protein
MDQWSDIGPPDHIWLVPSLCCVRSDIHRYAPFKVSLLFFVPNSTDSHILQWIARDIPAINFHLIYIYLLLLPNILPHFYPSNFIGILQNQVPVDALVPPKLTTGTSLAPRGKLVFTTGILGTIISIITFPSCVSA